MVENSHTVFRNFSAHGLFKYSEGLERILREKSRRISGPEVSMRYLKYVAILALLMVPMAYSQAQVSVGVGIGPVGVAVGPAPVCAYGYYGYAPYTCAPYG